MSTPSTRTVSSRVTSTKSKTGCITCKIRRVKCGEEKPKCYRCTSTGRQCDYKNASSSLSVTLGRTAFSSSIQPDISFSPAGQRERRAFEFYFHRAAPALSGILDLGFWRGIVLQTCRSEPAIWDAIISMSTLYESPPENKPQMMIVPAKVRTDRHREALAWYSRSLASLQRQIQQGAADIIVALISCALFLVIEVLQGNLVAALALQKQATELIMSTATAAETKSTSSSPLATMIVPVFRRMDALGLILNDDPFASEPSTRISSVLRLEDSFTTLSGAKTALYALIAQWKVINRDAIRHLRSVTNHQNADEIASLTARQESLKVRLLGWHQNFLSLEAVRQFSTFSSASGGKLGGAIATLLMAYISTLILARNGLAHDETAYDVHESDFAQIIAYAPLALTATANDDGTQPHFTFEMGIGLPLFTTALKCRSPLLRRKALWFLRQTPPVPSVYAGIHVVDVLACIIAMEENRATCEAAIAGGGGGKLILDELLARPGRIPALNERVRDFILMPPKPSEGRMQFCLRFTRHEYEGGGKWKLVEEVSQILS